MRGRIRRAAVLALLGPLVLLAGVGSAGAQQVDGPTLGVDRASVRPGEQVVITLDGWRSRVITVSVCGNQAARGSSDCNMVASEGIGRNRDGSATSRDFTVLAPALPCPCVLRASTVTNDEVAVVPIDLVGHPVGPIVGTDPLGSPLEVEVTSERAGSGFLAGLRSSLGGPTTYDVTVSVRNRSSQRLEHVVLSGTATGRRGDVDALELPAVGALDPGQRWRHTVRSTVPAPAIGSFDLEVTASGAGPSVTVRGAASNTPVALGILLAVLVADLAVLVRRRRSARRRARVDAQGRQQATDALLDLVPDRADRVDALAGGIR